MLSRKSQENLLKALKVPEDQIATMLGDAETEFDIPAGLSVLTDTELGEIKGRVKAGHETAYPEILGKKLNEEYGLGLTTTEAKDLKKVHEAMAKKAVAEAKLDPDKKVTELNTSLERLRQQLAEKETAIQQHANQLKEIKELQTWESLIPEGATKVLTKEEHINRMRKVYDLGEDGTIIEKATGQAKKNNLEQPIKPADAIAELYKTNAGWMDAPVDPAAGKAARPHHGTAQPNGTGKGSFDYDKEFTRLSANYDMGSLDGRAALTKELTALQVAAAQA